MDTTISDKKLTEVDNIEMAPDEILEPTLLMIFLLKSVRVV